MAALAALIPPPKPPPEFIAKSGGNRLNLVDSNKSAQDHGSKSQGQVNAYLPGKSNKQKKKDAKKEGGGGGGADGGGQEDGNVPPGQVFVSPFPPMDYQGEVDNFFGGSFFAQKDSISAPKLINRAFKVKP